MICKDYLIINKVSERKYYINNDFDCQRMNVIHLISSVNCNEQYIVSVVDLKNVLE